MVGHKNFPHLLVQLLDPGPELRDPGSEIRDPGSEIRDPDPFTESLPIGIT
jgi:hypothetical protein